MKVGSINVARVLWMVLLAMALLMTVLSVRALASRASQHEVNSNLMTRYVGPLKESEKDKPGNSKDKPAAGATDKSKPGGSSTGPGGSPDKPKGKTPQDEQAERITKRNIFSPPQPPKQFKGKLIGVLGDSALFQDKQMVKVGEQYQGAKVTQIGPDWAELEFEGKPVRLSVFGGDSGGGGQPPSMPSPRRSMSPDGPPGAVMAPSSAPSRPGRSSTAIPPEAIEQFKKMSPEERQRALPSAPPEILEQLKQQGLL